MSNDALRMLAHTPLLAGLDDTHRARLLAASRQIEVEQGTQLITTGDVAETLYLVLRGRFTVVAGGQAIADIGAGEPIGEIAFFAHSTRSADVIAARSGAVLVLTRKDWEWLARDVPEISQAILASLAERLAETSRSAPAMRPLASRAVALIGEIPPPAIEALIAALPEWMVLHPKSDNPLGRLYRLESEGRKVLLISPDDSLLDEMDEAFDFVSLSGNPAPSLAPATLNTPVSLVLWRKAASQPIVGTTAWLDIRQPQRHHHIALDRPEDMARLARFIEGRALGLVLSGGGAQGTAHLGAIKAFGEFGLSFDTIGGTSAGAAMGAALALGRDPDEVMDLIEDIFLRSRAMSRYTLPKYSVLDPGLFDTALRQHYGTFMIEDLATPFFAVATSLSTNDVAVMDRGPLWQAVRASTSIPVVFPPWIGAGGTIMVDGAMIDNAPITVMRARKPGPSVLLNLYRNSDWRTDDTYGSLPGRFGALWQVLMAPLRKSSAGNGFPTAIAVLSRVFNVNAQRRLRSIEAPGDVMIDIQPLEGMAFLDWTKSRHQYDESYAAFTAALIEATAQGFSPKDPVAMLAAVKRNLPWATTV